MNPYDQYRDCPKDVAVLAGQVGYDNLVIVSPYGYKINGVGGSPGIDIIMLYLDPNEP